MSRAALGEARSIVASARAGDPFQITAAFEAAQTPVAFDYLLTELPDTYLKHTMDPRNHLPERDGYSFQPPFPSTILGRPVEPTDGGDAFFDYFTEIHGFTGTRHAMDRLYDKRSQRGGWPRTELLLSKHPPSRRAWYLFVRDAWKRELIAACFPRTRGQL